MAPDLSALNITDTEEGSRFSVKVVPGSSRDRVAGVLGQALKVNVATAPEKGAANKALLKVLAHHLALRPAQIRILSGHSQARKQILVLGLNTVQLRSRFG